MIVHIIRRNVKMGKRNEHNFELRITLFSKYIRFDLEFVLIGSSVLAIKTDNDCGTKPIVLSLIQTLT